MIGAIKMDLSKVFDCMPHELLVSKLEAYTVLSPNRPSLFYHICPAHNSVAVLAKSAIHGKPQAKVFHKDLFSVLWFY